jgi:hypothetical protein
MPDIVIKLNSFQIYWVFIADYDTLDFSFMFIEEESRIEDL